MILFWLMFSGFGFGVILISSIVYNKLGYKIFLSYAAFLVVGFLSFIGPSEAKYPAIIMAGIFAFSFFYLTKSLQLEFKKYTNIRLILNISALVFLVCYALAATPENATLASAVIACFVTSLFTYAYSAILALDARLKTA